MKSVYRLAAFAAALCTLLLSSASFAQNFDRGALVVEAVPLLGDASIYRGHWFELLLRVRNTSSAPFEGTAEVFGSRPGWNGGKKRGKVQAPVKVAAGAQVSLRLPVVAGYDGQPFVVIRNSADEAVSRREMKAGGGGQTILFNVSKSGALASKLSGVTVGCGFEPWTEDGTYSVNDTPADVVSARYSAVTGGALLPHRAAAYARVAAVLIDSDELVRLGAKELEALSGYLLGGGTLAVVVTRPEDLNNTTLQALVGGTAEAAPTPPELTAVVALSAPPPSSGIVPAPLPSAGAPPQAIAATLRGYRGGNLAASSYGASAAYGLGEVHLLGFDPNRPPANDQTWTQVRILDLLRRANERTAAPLIRHGQETPNPDGIRRLLDPNQSARWAIIVATLFLLLYAIVAGPITYNHWRKRGRPLRAIFMLPVMSLGAFVMVFLLGLFAKGINGRARHFVIVDAAAGMKRAVARRYRAFYVPRARTISISARSNSSVLLSRENNYQLDQKVVTTVDDRGSRLSDLQLQPWEALLVREDDYADLAGGISIIEDKAGAPVIHNKTGKSLEGLMLVNKGHMKFLARLDDGAAAREGDFRRLSSSPVQSQRWPSGMPYQGFAIHNLDEEALSELDSELARAWRAAADTRSDQRDWFPADVPVLLAQIAGGESTKKDTGLKVDQQRMLIRVVGWGGTP